jgi:hypothetical protein
MILLDVVFLNLVNRLLKLTTMELTLANILKYGVILYNRIFIKVRLVTFIEKIRPSLAFDVLNGTTRPANRHH